MTPEQRQAHSWLNKPKETVTAKIIWTMEACQMMHATTHANNQCCPGEH